MGKFRDRIEGLMRGRYGIDELYYFAIALCLVLMVVNAFVQSPIIGAFMWVFLVCAIFRSFSRNIYKRRLENDRFLSIWMKLKAKCSLTIRRVKEIRTHRFRRCPQCKAVLRLPRKTGKHAVRCPRCHNEFSMRIIL